MISHKCIHSRNYTIFRLKRWFYLIFGYSPKKPAQYWQGKWSQTLWKHE